MSLVNCKITQVRDTILHYITCILYCLPPQGKSPFITIYPFTFFYLTPHPLPCGNKHTFACVHQPFFSLLIPSLLPSLQLPPFWQLYVLCTHESVFTLSLILFTKFHMQIKLYGTCLLLSGLFQWAYYSPGQSMLSQKVWFHSFLWPSSIPLCKCAKFFFLSTHILMNMGYF